MIYLVCLLCIVNYCYGQVAFISLSNKLINFKTVKLKSGMNNSMNNERQPQVRQEQGIFIQIFNRKEVWYCIISGISLQEVRGSTTNNKLQPINLTDNIGHSVST